MSKRNRSAARDADALAAIEKAARREDALIQARLDEQQERFDAEASALHHEVELAIAEEKDQRAQQQLEAEAIRLQDYRDQVVTAAVSSQAIAPQFARFIGGTSKQEIDAAIEQAKASTAEILDEIAGARPDAASAHLRDAQGRFIAEQPVAERGLPTGLSAEQAKNMTLQDWARVRGQYINNTTDRGLFS